MLHPVGSLPPSVYWRRRIALLGSLVVLIGLTAWVLHSHGGSTPAAGASSSPSNAPSSTVPPSSATQTASVPSSTASTATTTPSATAASSVSASHSATPATCLPGQLAVAAATSKPAFAVGDEPVVILQVTNRGPAPCVQDLADSQVELRVYNGASRVWGSHDCQIEPGVMDRTLAVGQPVRVSEVWSGLSSQPHCAGVRQRVGAGTYTLYPLLAGHEGTASQFAIS